MRDSARAARVSIVRRVREDKSVISQYGADIRTTTGATFLVRIQDLNRVLIERDPPHLVRLGIFDNYLTVVQRQAPTNCEHSCGDVQIIPGESEQLTASRAGDERQPDERSPAVVLLPRRVDDFCRFLG